MEIEIMVIYGLFVIALLASLRTDLEKTKRAFVAGARALRAILPDLLIITALLGLLLGVIVPPEAIEAYLGEGAGFTGTLFAAVFGAITLIPNIIAMPLAGSLLRSGAAVMTVAAFITTLTMVGTITFPLEKETLGLRFAIYRNILSFLSALAIAALMGVVLA